MKGGDMRFSMAIWDSVTGNFVIPIQRVIKMRNEELVKLQVLFYLRKGLCFCRTTRKKKKVFYTIPLVQIV